MRKSDDQSVPDPLGGLGDVDHGDAPTWLRAVVLLGAALLSGFVIWIVAFR